MRDIGSQTKNLIAFGQEINMKNNLKKIDNQYVLKPFARMHPVIQQIRNLMHDAMYVLATDDVGQLIYFNKENIKSWNVRVDLWEVTAFAEDICEDLIAYAYSAHHYRDYSDAWKTNSFENSDLLELIQDFCTHEFDMLSRMYAKICSSYDTSLFAEFFEEEEEEQWDDEDPVALAGSDPC